MYDMETLDMDRVHGTSQEIGSWQHFTSLLSILRVTQTGGNGNIFQFCRLINSPLLHHSSFILHIYEYSSTKLRDWRRSDGVCSTPEITRCHAYAYGSVHLVLGHGTTLLVYASPLISRLGSGTPTNVGHV